MPLSWPQPKDPQERLPYSLDWSQRLGESNALSSSEWLLVNDEQNDSQLVIYNMQFTPTRTTVWLEGGTVGRRYTLLNRVETNTGWTMEQSIRLKVKEK